MTTIRQCVLCPADATTSERVAGIIEPVCAACAASLRESTLDAKRAIVDTLVARLGRLADVAPDVARECANNAVQAVDVDPPMDYGLGAALTGAIEHRVNLSHRPNADPTWRCIVARVIRRHVDLDRVGCDPSAQSRAAIDWLSGEATKGVEW